MIARILIYLLLIIILPDLYLDIHYWRKKTNFKWYKRLLWWTPAAVMLVYTIKMGVEKNFVPDNPTYINTYLFLLGLLIIPKFVFMLCSLMGLAYCRIFKKRRNYGNLLGLLLSVLLICILLYGSTLGFKQLQIKHIDISSKDLPAAFDGYRIVHWSDAHVGTYLKHQYILQRAIDSIKAQNADMIAFTGDLQNLQPSELYPFQQLLSSIKAKDGVYSVLGNHDYSMYIDAPNAIKMGNEREMVSRQKQFGWTLLMNQHKAIYRENDSIIIAGTENDGLPPYPAKANISKTLQGVKENAFVIMLQHDPSAWKRHILPLSNAQVTLSGHTHGGQFSLFGMRFTKLITAQDYGLYQYQNRYLYVSCGLGGLVPFRFGMPGEITVITLHRKK